MEPVPMFPHPPGTQPIGDRAMPLRRFIVEPVSTTWPVFICVLGPFRLLSNGRSIHFACGSTGYYFKVTDYAVSLRYSQLLLTLDPYREDAHRLAMRCYVRRGERSQALRQYRLCVHALRAEFDAAPEPATTALFDEVRANPGTV